MAGWFNFVFLGAVTVFFLAFAPELVRFFGDNPEVDMIAQRGLRIMVLSFPFYAFGLVVLQAFNGAGDTWTPTWLNFIVFWLIEIPVAWLLSVRLGLGPDGVFWAICTAFATLPVAATLVWRRGKWREVKV